jgi:nicotinate-nucleotide adenylyltransferase
MKEQSIYSSLESRVEKCREITRPYKNKIYISDIEKNFRNFYSSSSLEKIKMCHRDIDFYWIIGCDNLLQIDKWYNWEKIFKLTKVLVCERTSMVLKSHNVRASHKFQPQHIYNNSTISQDISHFYILHGRKINLSSSEIRRGK